VLYGFMYSKITIKTYFCKVASNVENFPFSAALYIRHVFRATTFGKSPRRVTDAQMLLLAGSQHRCSVDRADALKVCLHCVGIFDWKDWQKKKSTESATRHDHLSGNIPWTERWRFRRAGWNGCYIHVLRYVQKRSEDRVKVSQWLVGADDGESTIYGREVCCD